MTTNEFYKQKIAAELRQVQAKLAEFDEPGKKSPTIICVNRTKSVDAPKNNVKQRGEVNKDVWDLLRYCI